MDRFIQVIQKQYQNYIICSWLYSLINLQGPHTSSPPGRLTAESCNIESSRELVSIFQRLCCTSTTLPTTTSPISPTYRLLTGCTQINLFTFCNTPATDDTRLSPTVDVPWPLENSTQIYAVTVEKKLTLSLINYSEANNYRMKSCMPVITSPGM